MFEVEIFIELVIKIREFYFCIATVTFPNPFWLHKGNLKDLIFVQAIIFENKIASNITDYVIFSFIAICLLILALILNATVQ